MRCFKGGLEGGRDYDPSGGEKALHEPFPAGYTV